MEQRGSQRRGEPWGGQEVGGRSFPPWMQTASRPGTSSQDINRRGPTNESSSAAQRLGPRSSRGPMAAQAVPDLFPGADPQHDPCSSGRNMPGQSSRTDHPTTQSSRIHNTPSNAVTSNMSSSAAGAAAAHSPIGMRTLSERHRHQHVVAQEEEVTNDDESYSSVRRLEARVQTLQRQLAGLQRYTALVQQIGARQSETENQMENQTAVQTRNQVARRRVAARPAEQQNNRTRRPFQETERMEQEEDDEDAEGDESTEEQQFHVGVSCDGCGAGGALLIGTVMKCQDCDNIDFCARCFRDRNQLGPHRSHRFAPRQPSLDRPMLVADMLLSLMEEDMLQEAMRQSSEGHRGDEPEPVDPEIRAAEILSKLPRTQWKPTCNHALGSEAEECSLCLDHFKKGEDILTLPCEHFFHENCLTPWLIKSNLCPMCKRDAISTDP